MIQTYNNGWQFNRNSMKELGLFLGYELEFDGRDGVGALDTARTIKRIFEEKHIDVKLESDCSLDNGYELVFPPMTLSIIEQLRPQLTQAFRILQRMGFNNNNEKAGGHIHITRRALGKSLESREATLQKIINWFIANKDDLYKYSGRTQRGLRWCVIYDVHYGRRERYQAINVQNRHTVEFRLFNAPISVTEFLANGQLVKAIVETAKSRHINLLDLTLDQLVTKYERKYKELAQYWKSL